MKFTSIYIPIFLALSIYLAACSEPSGIPEEKMLLAQINDKFITIKQFENAFNYYYRKTGYTLEPNSRVKLNILENEFNKLVLAQAAQDMGLDLKEEVIHKNKIIEKQYLVDLYEKEVLSKRVNVTEKDVREIFVYFNTKADVSHLYATTFEKANELKNRLDNGETFDELAKEIFRTPYLANNGGNLGEIGFDEMDIAFELAAFNAKVGEIVGPIKTAQGYSIIKVNSKYTKPILTENEFNTLKDKLYVIAERRALELIKRSDLEHFVNKFSLDSQISKKIWTELQAKLKSDNDSKYIRNYILSILPKFNGVVGRYNSWEVDVKKVLMELYYSPELTLKRANSYQAFKNMMIGSSYRVYQLDQVKKIDSAILADYKNRIKYAQYLNLVNELEHFTLDNIVIPEFEIFEYFSKNQSEFVLPLQLDLFRVKTNSRKDAIHVLEELKSRKQSELSILKKYGIDNEDLLYQGRTGLKPIHEFGTIGLKLKNLQIGQISDVLEVTNNEYHVYVCKNRIESRPLNYDEAREQVADILKKKVFEQKKRQLINETMNRHNAQIYKEKIQTLALKLN